MGSIGNTIRQTLGPTAGGMLGGTFDFLGKGLGIDQYEMDKGAFNPDAGESAFTQFMLKRAQEDGSIKGPTIAEQQQRRGLDKATAQAQSLAASQRGIAPGLAARLASQQMGATQQDILGQAGELRAREEAANRALLTQERQLLGNIFGSQRQSRAQREAGGLGAYEGSAGRASQFIQNMGSAMTGGAAMAYGGAIVDSPANDKVPAMLSPGEIVVPKSVVQMGPEASSQFVAALSRYVR